MSPADPRIEAQIKRELAEARRMPNELRWAVIALALAAVSCVLALIALVTA